MHVLKKYDAIYMYVKPVRCYTGAWQTDEQNPYQSINQSIRKIFNVSRITNVIARSTET